MAPLSHLPPPPPPSSGARGGAPSTPPIGVRDGDVLAVWRLDRLGRSMPHLIETIGALDARGIGFLSLTESIDTTTSGGRLIFHVFGALGQFERDLIRERTKAGLSAAAARGRGGRSPGRSTGFAGRWKKPRD